MARNGNAQDAVAAFRAALVLNPDIPHIRPQLVALLWESGQVDEAREEADICREKGIALPPELGSELQSVP